MEEVSFYGTNLRVIVVFQGVSCEPGEVVFGCVLDWDFDKKILHVSLNAELVAQRKTARSQKTKQKKVTLILRRVALASFLLNAIFPTCSRHFWFLCS